MASSSEEMEMDPSPYKYLIICRRCQLCSVVYSYWDDWHKRHKTKYCPECGPLTEYSIIRARLGCNIWGNGDNIDIGALDDFGGDDVEEMPIPAPAPAEIAGPTKFSDNPEDW